MRIADIRITPVTLPYKKPYVWAQGINHGATVVLVRVVTDEGITGIGESLTTYSSRAVVDILEHARPVCLGQPVFDVSRLMASLYQTNFATHGTGSARRFSALVFTGLELALWDAIGKAVQRPVHQLLGGAVRDEIEYFGFLQGETPEELAADAAAMVAAGHEVIYVKIGRGADLDVAIARAVREAIGERRLRLDANEAWDTLTASRMIARLMPYEPEFIEQPVRSESLAALEQVKRSTGVAIAADQLVFTPEDVYEVCRHQAADLIVLGLHEAGGLVPFRNAAAVAATAGLNVCLHGVFESGITTCASNQVAATIPNLDDGNQYMNHLLTEDLVAAPDLTLRDGKLGISTLPGLGFELDEDAVARAAERYRETDR